jgi:hypothetical protein
VKEREREREGRKKEREKGKKREREKEGEREIEVDVGAEMDGPHHRRCILGHYTTSIKWRRCWKNVSA